MTIRPQAKNANRHTQRGMQALETSLATDGWIGAITVAADGETFDGSARVEKTAENGMLDDAIVIDSDGTRPIVVRRTDIPNAQDERAVRLGIAANRVASLNLEWEPDVLAGLAGIDLSSLFTAAEFAELSMPALPEAGNGGDSFDTEPEDGPTRTSLGELWSIGGVHRLFVGDCTDAANVARLMGGERAQTTFTDPPYNVGIDYDNEGDDQLQDYAAFSLAWFRACESDCIVFTPGTVNLALWYSIENPKWVCVWRKTNQSSPSGLQGFNTWEPLLVYGKQPKPVGHDSWDIPVEKEMDRSHPEHPVAKTMEAWQAFLEAFTTDGAIVYDPFLGSGTTLIAAHRTGRRCYGMEISPKYCDVILRRAEAEGLECVLIDG